MSKEEYAEEMMKYVFHYEQGRKEERERILKLIDEKIKPLEKEQRNRTTVNEYNSFAIKKLKELQKELTKK